MARPPLGIGKHGRINTVRMSPEGVKPEQWRARTRFRDLDGVTRPVERWASSKTKAERAVQDACQDRVGKPVAQLTGSSRVRDLAPVYLESIRQRRAATTYDRYKTAVDKHIVPAVGGLLVRECTTARLQDFLDDVDDSIDDGDDDRVTLSGSYRSLLRSVLRGMMQIAVRRELLDANPGRELDRLTYGTKRRRPRALSADELRDFLTKLDADQTAQDADLCDMVRILFGTGLRVGEALALRWCDLNMTEDTITMTNAGDQKKVPARSIWVNGGVVYAVGKSAFRNEGKSFSANRIVGMPDFLHTLLWVRRPDNVPDTAPIFPSPKGGGWKQPRSVARSLQKVRDRIGYPGLTTHWGRKTVATLLDEAGQTPRQVADQLGHSDIHVTQKHYFARGMANPGAVSAIDAWHQPKK